jgi:plastocyanin
MRDAAYDGSRRMLTARSGWWAALVLLSGGPGVALAGDIAGTVVSKRLRHGVGAVVYVDRIPNAVFSVPAEHAVMDQKDLAFVPHLLPILAGTTVDFRNSDTVLHNIFSPDSCSRKFNLGTWPRGGVRTHTFTQAGCTPVILCNLHPDMEAFVVVLETPYFSRTASDGSYVITGVPAGSYTVKVWHEKLSAAPREVTVPASGRVRADFVLRK